MNERQIVLAAPPRRDPVVATLKVTAVFLAAVLLVMITGMAHRDVAMASLHCPAPDHAVWADSLGPWWYGWYRGEALCGASLVIGVKAGR